MRAKDAGLGLRTAWRWRLSRNRHRIGRPAPPLQQLDECELAHGRRGLVGLGMAGTSHWSLAVEAQRGQLWFDVACRIQQSPQRLLSEYRLSAACVAKTAQDAVGERRRGLAHLPHGLTLQFCPDDGSTELVIGGQCDRLEFRPRKLPDSLPATVRWRYGFVATA